MDRNCTTRVKPPLPNLQDLKEPAAIAFSGGGDSTALLHACASHPYITHAFIIDHALRRGSAAEVAKSAEFARGLGYRVQTQRWAHDGVTTGIQVKARQYRYAAMGDMCRRAGLKHLFTAHTADDQAETLLMRLDRGTGWRGLAGMRETATAPLWPALHGVTLHRPWLGVLRADLRAYNRDAGLDFVDDPSNENRDFTRVRARQALFADSHLRRDLLAQQTSALKRLIAERHDMAVWLSRFAKINPHGFIETSAVPTPELLLHLLNSASGKGGPIDAAKRIRMSKAMSQSSFSGATLAGAWVKRSPHGFLFTRDIVAVKPRHEAGANQEPLSVPLTAGEPQLWDGRFLVQTNHPDITAAPAYGQLSKLRNPIETKDIFGLPAEVRGCLPVYSAGEKPVGFGGVETGDVNAEAVSAQRLHHLA